MSRLGWCFILLFVCSFHLEAQKLPRPMPASMLKQHQIHTIRSYMLFQGNGLEQLYEQWQFDTTGQLVRYETYDRGEMTMAIVYFYEQERLIKEWQLVVLQTHPILAMDTVMTHYYYHADGSLARQVISRPSSPDHNEWLYSYDEGLLTKKEFCVGYGTIPEWYEYRYSDELMLLEREHYNKFVNASVRYAYNADGLLAREARVFFESPTDTSGYRDYIYYDNGQLKETRSIDREWNDTTPIFVMRFRSEYYYNEKGLLERLNRYALDQLANTFRFEYRTATD